MIKITIHDNKQATQFTHLISNIHKLSEGVVLRFRKNYLYAQGIDKAHAVLFEFKIHCSWFHHYDATLVNDADEIPLGINTNILSKVFNTKEDNQSVDIVYETDADTIEISFKNLKDATYELPKDFSIPLIDITSEMIPIENSDYDVEFGIATKLFNTVSDQLKFFDNDVSILCDENNIKLSASGSEGSMSINLLNTDVEYVTEYACVEGAEFNFMFRLRYFNLFCSFIKLANEVKLSFGDELPMQMRYDLDDAEQENSSFLRFFLAPKS